MLVAGVISGTSVDGIDVALVEIEGAGFEQRIRQVAFQSVPYPSAVRQGVLAVSNAATHTARLSQLNVLLGELFGEAVVAVCRNAGVKLQDLDLVGSHGQTIYHQAEATTIYDRRIASTLQIGEPAMIAALVGAPVVADFRPADMAVGGQGAPLVPYVDYLLYRDAALGRVSLNIGGIANLTAIPPGAEADRVFAFDTGPGNMIIDSLVSQFSRGVMSFDRDGKMAASGRVNADLLSALMRDPYLRFSPPKSCGREQYGAEFIVDLLREDLEPNDLVATATAFTAASVADALERFISPKMRVDELIVSGGGVKNPEIMRRLAEQAPDSKVVPSDERGVDSDAKEALAFAVMAYETWFGRPSNLPSATGAGRQAVLGKICRPPV